MIYLNLFITFFKISIFSFGGGMAMLPLIQEELLINKWMSEAQFLDIVVISQITPGAIVVNCATFVGNKVAGLGGAFAATLGVATPSIILIYSLFTIITKLKDNFYKNIFFYAIKPVSVALILYAGYLIAKAALVTADLNPNFPSIIIMAIAFFIREKYKLNPIILVVCSGLLGIFIF